MNLSELTTLRVGGPAARLLQPATRDELVATALELWSGFDEWFVLGGGSNVVVADEGIDGDVLRVVTRGIERTDSGIRVQAGEPWDGVVEYAVANGLAGIEALSGIPGTAGAAPIQNIGAYGQELGETLVAIDFLDFATGDVLRLPTAELGLGYRTSELKRGRLGVVLSLELALTASGDGLSRPIAYEQLAKDLGVQPGEHVPLAQLRAAVIALRASKGMIWDAADPDSISAGSFFTNPIVSENFARGLPSDAPRWPTEPERPPRVLPLGAPIPVAPASGEYLVKLSAAWLIEHSGISRGFALPGSGAAISSKHTLAIVNRGHATARDIVQLAGYVQTRVMSEFGVLLQPEPVLVGVHL
ncbi:UDP-N-acetylmuramate dehydrogenase [Lysinimonas soli]|uniref:UDP-N-acetylenolpyruvoylglucosamine reductase n=1 Tax=Lysinimonas soli TaxID=1074233 RepID=A0ABW0NSG6_9MICO